MGLLSSLLLLIISGVITAIHFLGRSGFGIIAKRLSYFLAIFLVLALTQSALAGTNEFGQQMFFVTPQVGVNAFTVPFGLSAEYGLTPKIGLGGTVMYWHWSESNLFWTFGWTAVSLSADGTYHFTGLKVEKLDLFAGASLGFVSVSSSGEGIPTITYNSGLWLTPFLGCRYFFTPKVAFSINSYFSFLGSLSGIGLNLGVTIRF